MDNIAGTTSTIKLTLPNGTIIETTTANTTVLIVLRQLVSLLAVPRTAGVVKFIDTRPRFNRTPNHKRTPAAAAAVDILDKICGIQCASCGYEPPTIDRSKQCPKCNATAWEHCAAPRMEVPEQRESV